MSKKIVEMNGLRFSAEPVSIPLQIGEFDGSESRIVSQLVSDDTYFLGDVQLIQTNGWREGTRMFSFVPVLGDFGVSDSLCNCDFESGGLVRNILFKNIFVPVPFEVRNPAPFYFSGLKLRLLEDE